jgi:PAS domain S-box-containing protein
MSLLSAWLPSSGLMPHGFCYQWKPTLIWLHAASDTLIALAYLLIPIALIYFIHKRKDVPFGWMFICFGVFIAACGATHLMEVWTLWVPSYWVAGGVKVITAVASIPTAVFLVQLIPQALSLPSPDALRAANEELIRQAEILKKSEERFQAMANNIQEIFWMMDPETKAASYVSPAFEQLCEAPIDSIYADPTSYRDLIHPEDRQRVMTGLKNLASTNCLDEEFRIVCPSGTVKWVRAIGFNSRDAAGVVKSYVGTVQEITARKLMEVALRESEDLFRDMVEHSSDLICTHTLEGKILSVNEMPARLLGYTREEVLAKPMRDFLLPEARAEFDESMKTIQRDGAVKGLMVVLTKSGERRIWEYHNTLRRDGVSVPVVRGVAHDVTEQKRMEKALRLSEEKFSKAFQASPYAIVISTIEDDRLIEVNDSFLQIMGFTRAECVGRSSQELRVWTSPNDREDILKEIRQCGRVKAKQIVFRAKGGNELIVNYTAEVIGLSGRNCLLSVCEDITDRRQAETRLREYETAVEGVEEMIAVVDRDYRYLLANRAFLAFKGLTKEQVIGHSVSEILTQDSFEQEVKQRLDGAFRRRVVTFETRYKYSAVGERDLLVSYFPIEGVTFVEKVVCVLRDITERKQAEQELRRLSGQLLKLQDEERRKIARDLHDSTGQDLVALATSFGQLHKAIPSSSRKGRKLAAQCQAVADRCLREVRTLSYVLHPPMLDEAGLEDAIRHFTDGFGERTGIAVELEITPHFGRLQQYVELGLFRVVQESLTNIQRHSGSFTAKIKLLRYPDKIVLEVSDAGRGISVSTQRRNGSPSLPLGVGIPSMEERVKQIGGQLRIESSASGTNVLVTVPAHD